MIVCSLGLVCFESLVQHSSSRISSAFVINADSCGLSWPIYRTPERRGYGQVMYTGL